MDSILTSIKKLLGIAEEYEQFDQDIIMAINSAMSIGNQIGIGPAEGYSIQDKTDTWNDFMPDCPKLEMFKNYVFYKVKLMFDPPLSSAAIESINKMAAELEWRISISGEPTGEANA